MAVTAINRADGIQQTRENYVLPALNTTAFPDTRRIRYLGDKFSLLQGVQIDLSGVTLTLTKTSSTGWNATKLFDFAKGNMFIPHALITGTYTTGANSGASEALLVSLGSTATAEATLATTEVDIVASTSNATTTNAGTLKALKTAALWWDGTATALSVYLNLAQAANVTTGDSSVTFGSNTTVTLYYVQSILYNV